MFSAIQSPVLRQFAVVILANFAVINLGLDMVWPSPILVKLRAENQTILSQPLRENQEPWIAAINAPFATLALLTTGSLMNWLGRKKALLLAYIPRLVMCLLMIFATNVWMLLVARALSGIADSITISVVSTYISEAAGTKIRGASGTITQIMSAIGMMIMLAVGPFVSYLTVNVMMICIAAASIVPLLFIPESPYYLNAIGRVYDAEEVLTFLRGSRELALKEIMEYSKKADEEPVLDKWSLIKDKIVLKTTGIVFFLAVGAQMVGYNTINLYLQTIFESTQTSVSPEISSLISGLIQLIACLCTFMLTDRFGRKPILCISLMGMCVGMTALATFFFLFENGREITGFLNHLPLISIAFVIFGYNAGLGSLLWIQVAELYDGRARPYGISLAMFEVSVFYFLLTLIFPSMINNIGAGSTYLIFAVSCAVVCLFTFVVIPETKGRSYAEIQKDLGRRDLNVDDNKPDKLTKL